jgi:hypothetical protein
MKWAEHQFGLFSSFLADDMTSYGIEMQACLHGALSQVYLRTLQLNLYKS